ncbi:hypothetical protein KGF54_003787 [Candida jiufengensis]|uniref:uncharacterized protein n=1 Tax=Candida jiufengensis TaxID=497108 RepID=UPI002224825D|nr:uncharacterized protein KGF54_003787 [Candida jiufengensis]KAI5950713.1 hypothetical protein KGF54_003787 [Candida jiufengensis]
MSTTFQNKRKLDQLNEYTRTTISKKCPKSKFPFYPDNIDPQIILKDVTLDGNYSNYVEEDESEIEDTNYSPGKFGQYISQSDKVGGSELKNNDTNKSVDSLTDEVVNSQSEKVGDIQGKVVGDIQGKVVGDNQAKVDIKIMVKDLIITVKATEIEIKN